MRETLGPEGFQGQIDSIRISRVARALGIQLGGIPDEDLPAIRGEISALEQHLRVFQQSDQSGIVLTDELAERISYCLQELPNNTLLKDLFFWRTHPLKLPPWTSLMLSINHREAIQISNLTGKIIRSDEGMNITLAQLVSEFDINSVKRGVGVVGRLFFLRAFQITPESAEDFQPIDEEHMRNQLRERGILRSPKPPREHIPRKPPDTLKNVERDLWDYAIDNNLLMKLLESKSISAEELEQLAEYFENRDRKVTIRSSLMERFSQAVARLA